MFRFPPTAQLRVSFSLSSLGSQSTACNVRTCKIARCLSFRVRVPADTDERGAFAVVFFVSDATDNGITTNVKIKLTNEDGNMFNRGDLSISFPNRIKAPIARKSFSAARCATEQIKSIGICARDAGFFVLHRRSDAENSFYASGESVRRSVFRALSLGPHCVRTKAAWSCTDVPQSDLITLWTLCWLICDWSAKQSGEFESREGGRVVGSHLKWPNYRFLWKVLWWVTQLADTSPIDTHWNARQRLHNSALQCL